MLRVRAGLGAPGQAFGQGGLLMRLRRESAARGSFPNAILTRMRRRIPRVGLLVGVLAALLAAVVVFTVCACQTIR